MSSKKFESFEAFRQWANLADGDIVILPFGSSKGWEVIIAKEVEITSPFYRIGAGGNYGAAMIHGHSLPFGEKLASGVVEFGLDDAGVMQVSNRRRVTEADSFNGETHQLVEVITAQPDRVIEPVAVTIAIDALQVARQCNAEQRLALYSRVRDGVELAAVRALWAFCDENEN